MSSQQPSKQTIKIGATLFGSVLAVAAFGATQQEAVVQAAPQAQNYNVNNPFLQSIAKYAQDLAGKNGLYASVMMAQAALESGYGSSTLSQAPANNLFGMKGSYNGHSVTMNTLEDDGYGNYYQIQAAFRAYPTYYESLSDYVNLIKNGTDWDPNYYAGAWKANTNSYQDATAYLTGRYATDTAYAGKLNSIIAQYDLTRFDTPGSGSNQSSSNNNQSTNKPTSGAKSYTVKAGDGLWTVAQALGTTIDAVKQANGLSSNLIFPGQVLYAPGNSSSHNSSNNSSHNQSTNKPTSGAKSYTVKAGDGLWTVAQALGTTIDAVKQANGLSSNLIFPGQVLYASGDSSSNNANSSSHNQSTNKPSSGAKSYTVKAGDGLWTVAQALGTTIDAVKQANGLSSNLIFPGQVLYAPGNSSSNNANSSSHNQSTNKPSSGAKSYTVKAGDGLWTVAQALGTTIDAVKQANGLSSNLIFPGQVLYAPGSSASHTSKPATTTPSHSSSSSATSVSGTYTVKAGDTQWHIAQTHGLTLQQLRSLNGLTNANLYVGQVLKVTGSQATSQQTTQTAKPGVAVGNRVDTNTPQTKKTYTIKAGDNLYRIALNHGVSLSELVSANHLGSANALIQPGQTLVIPGK
ncbi:MAG: LysM peptidoglycan-binding domain-containing protein [Aerococcus sp.]|nr:LysM peptidoglycan-binding domain-containing protein [Aerococcus sp.]